MCSPHIFNKIKGVIKTFQKKINQGRAHVAHFIQHKNPEFPNICCHISRSLRTAKAGIVSPLS